MKKLRPTNNMVPVEGTYMCFRDGIMHEVTSALFEYTPSHRRKTKKYFRPINGLSPRTVGIYKPIRVGVYVPSETITHYGSLKIPDEIIKIHFMEVDNLDKINIVHDRYIITSQNDIAKGIYELQKDQIVPLLIGAVEIDSEYQTLNPMKITNMIRRKDNAGKRRAE